LAIHETAIDSSHRWPPDGFYFMTNRPNGILHVGITDNLGRRAWEHREGVVEGFTKRYGLNHLVYFERYDDGRDARQRKQNLKHYARAGSG
jgi:putative endonuclease